MLLLEVRQPALIRVPALTGADTKFVLLHEGKNDEGIRAFFMDVWELYVKVNTSSMYIGDANGQQTMLNPFHTAHSTIRSSVFDNRVRASARKYL